MKNLVSFPFEKQIGFFSWFFFLKIKICIELDKLDKLRFLKHQFLRFFLLREVILVFYKSMLEMNKF